MIKLRYGIVWAVVLVILLVMNGLIYGKELLLTNGQVVFLDLAPRDPRSLIQGDYMALNYAITRNVSGPLWFDEDAYLALKLDSAYIAIAARPATLQTVLAPDEVLIAYRMRGGNLYLGAESFFFQEGQASAYTGARYAELRVGSAGESVLVGLRGPQLEALAPVSNVLPWWER
ncbi:MAG: GDYXXLXY domain-containing protein [Roseiflexaceae bacterium]|nr:GDYXXLXY domain-containing protein [Roseiflexaceae bacterium]